MPAIVGQILINNITSSGNAVFGDAPLITPKSAFKTYSGSGGSNTSVCTIINNLWSQTNTMDQDGSDSNIVSPGPGVYAPVIPPAVVPPVPVPVSGAKRISTRLPVTNAVNRRRSRAN